MIGALTLAVMAAATVAATPCEGLKAISLPNTTITSSEFVPEGPQQPAGGARGGGGGNRGDGARGGEPAATATGQQAPARGDGGAAGGGRGGGPPAILPAHCRVVAVLKPSADSVINMQLWLPPADKWNGKFQAVGNGGWAGSIQGLTTAMPAALRAGYATAGNDTGHEGANGTFALGHPEKLRDFADRAMHEMTVQSKALIKAFYDQGPRLSYYNGCSTGGRQGLMAAQRWPEDFDAILAGAPANEHTYMHAADIARMRDIYQDPEGYIPQAKQTVLAQAVMNACDALDGVKDSLITNPMSCKFDPAVLQCKAADAADCLTPKQVTTAKRLYQPLRTSKGELIFPGYPYGGESAYNVMRGGTAPGNLQLDTYRLAHNDANWDWKTFNVETDPALARKTIGYIDAYDPDMTKFKERGGKLMMYHGWADPAIQAEHTIIYYNSVLAKMGRSQDNWMRLFMVPGMGHCSGGAGPNQINWMSALETWREKGEAPAFIIGSGNNGGTPMTRPLCPHPQVATYKGSGDVNDAANFVCK
ncbi:MAG TPA: tannase/feruloyl esterase family alpha/beta hydrolase [Terriglobia bacterium]|nr:tannase/feruloyl esterase family alpha/beta hydrolase [Terriglobia bacterium]